MEGPAGPRSLGPPLRLPEPGGCNNAMHEAEFVWGWATAAYSDDGDGTAAAAAAATALAAREPLR